MPPNRTLLRTMSPKRARHSFSEDENNTGLERKGSLRGRSNSLRGALRLKQKTHEAPATEDEEAFKREWGMTREQEVGGRPVGLHPAGCPAGSVPAYAVLLQL